MKISQNLFIISILTSIVVLACSKDSAVPPIQRPTDDVKMYSYLALGDSYTIGTAIGSENSYAGQLADSLNHKLGTDSVQIEVVAQNGWTTANLSDGLTKAKVDSSFDLVSLLIGVNNQYQKRSLTDYRRDFRSLLEWSIALAQNDTSRLFVFSIPDWGVTPAGGGNSAQIASEIDQFNLVNKQISDSLNVKYFDITTISRKAANDPDLVASDGLHFSSKMHTLWVREYLEEILSILKED